MSSVFPDVGKTPSPNGAMPVPYGSVGRSKDVEEGSKRVKIQGASTMLKGAVYRRSTGDEAGSAGGVVSGVTRGECELAMYSFDVRIEGRNVGRMGDLMTHNRKNAVG